MIHYKVLNYYCINTVLHYYIYNINDESAVLVDLCCATNRALHVATAPAQTSRGPVFIVASMLHVVVLSMWKRKALYIGSFTLMRVVALWSEMAKDGAAKLSKNILRMKVRSADSCRNQIFLDFRRGDHSVVNF